jgi:hypothetical protein
MTTFFDMRQTGSDDTFVELEVHTNDAGSLVISLTRTMPEIVSGILEPEIVIVLGLSDAKKLRAALDETINRTITALAE